VNDGGDAETERVARERTGRETPVRHISKPQGGVASTRNAGARAATGDLLLFADDDVIVDPAHVERHVLAHERHANALVNGVPQFSARALEALRATPFGRYRIDLEQRFESEADGRWLGSDCFETEIVTARDLSIERSVFHDIGGFDDSFPYAGAEDQDLSLRARAAGCTLVRDHGIAFENDERTISLAQFCVREERSAETAVVLARKFPERAASMAIYRQNRPIARGDPPALVSKKAVKALLSRDLALSALDRAGAALDRLPGDGAWRRPFYEGLVGLHIFRGVRTGLRDR
jgi:glycosyltransferase involved in cell wall biosynthesis